MTKITSTVHEDWYTFCLSYLVQFFLEREPFETICREVQDTHFISNNLFFFRKSCRSWENVEKYGRVGQATDDNMAHAHACWITKATHTYTHTTTHTHTLRICNIYCISTVTCVARLYLHCLPSLNICFRYLGQTIIYCYVWTVAKCFWT